MSSRGDFCSILDDLAGRTIVRPTCDELCPQILSGLTVAERSLKMKSQTHLTISSASATALILLSFLSLASAAPIPQLTLAPRTHDGSFQSTNWSGYAVTGPSGSVSDAKGSWTVPAIQGSCPSTNQYSSFRAGILPLADFGTVSFSACTAIVSGTPGTIGSFGSSVQVITMVSNSGAVKAQPSSLSGSGGDSFSVTWKSSGP